MDQGAGQDAQRTDAPGLLEREAELAALCGALDDERPACLVLEGPAGAGKSALLAAARDHARAAGRRVLEARALELERPVAFALARQLAVPLLRDAPHDTRQRLLSGPGGLAASLLQGGDAVGLGLGEDHRLAVAHGLRWLLTQAAADDGPLAVFVDDAHWSDEPSLQFLAALADALEGLDAPLVLAVALRPEEPGAAPQLMARLLAAPRVTRLAPRPLSRDGVRALVAARAAQTAPAEAFVDAVATATGGNPFLVTELLEAVSDHTIAPTGDGLRELVPASVLRATLVRLGRLPADAGALARAVAVLGDRAPLARAAALAELDPLRAEEAADRLAAAHLLGPEEPLSFVHPLLGGAVRAEIPARARARMHARAARLLHDEGASAAIVCTQLLDAAPGTWEPAGRLLADGARAALDAGDYAGARRLAERALAEPVSERTRAALQIELAYAAAATGAEGARVALEQLLARAGDPAQRARGFLALAYDSYMRADMGAVVEAAQRGLAETGRAPLPAPEEEAVRRRLQDLELAAAIQAAGPAAEAVRARLAGPDPLASARSPLAHGVRTLLAAGRGAPPERVRALAAPIPAHTDGEALLAHSIAVSFAATGLLWSDELDAAQSLIEAVRAAAHRAGSLTAFGSASHLRGLLRLRRGDLAGALEDLQPPLDLSQRGWDLYRGWAAARACQVRVERGELEAAREALQRGPSLPADPAHDRVFDAFLLEARGDLALAGGDPAAALADYRRAGAGLARWQVANPGAVPWASSAAVAARLTGDAEQARELAAAAVAATQRVGVPRALARAWRAHAAVHDDLAASERAVAILDDVGLPLERAHALVELGAARRRRGQARAARQALRAGLHAAERAQAWALADRAEDELRAAGGRRTRERPHSGPAALTPSERRIATLAAEGHANADIARRLFLTTKTVEWHLTRAYRKLGVGSRRELADALRIT